MNEETWHEDATYMNVRGDTYVEPFNEMIYLVLKSVKFETSFDIIRMNQWKRPEKDTKWTKKNIALYWMKKTDIVEVDDVDE